MSNMSSQHQYMSTSSSRIGDIEHISKYFKLFIHILIIIFIEHIMLIILHLFKQHKNREVSEFDCTILFMCS